MITPAIINAAAAGGVCLFGCMGALILVEFIADCWEGFFQEDEGDL
jgi:hypothetical protein